MGVEEPDWSTLERLRRGFLDGTAGRRDYWNDRRDLEAYDATFAQRIGWKWDFVLEDLAGRGWAPPSGSVVDWGCGSGIAGRAFLDRFPGPAGTSVYFHDRSARAMEFAVARARARFPDRSVMAGSPETLEIVLISHVLTELESRQTEELVERLRVASCVIWVEPGTYEASLALIAIRERLRASFHPWAPCLHSGPCGILAPGNEAHWCHHFTDPPPHVFTDPRWARFSRNLGIDLRSVPLSYLALDRRPPPDEAADGPMVRRLGRCDVNKVEARMLVCSSAGVSERRVAKRTDPELWREARKGRLPSRFPIR